MVAATEAKPRGKFAVRISDVTGTRTIRLRDVGNESIGHVVDRTLPRMGLPIEMDGRAVSYSFRLEREGRHLHASEEASEVLQDEDELLVSPNIDAG